MSLAGSVALCVDWQCFFVTHVVLAGAVSLAVGIRPGQLMTCHLGPLGFCMDHMTVCFTRASACMGRD